MAIIQSFTNFILHIDSNLLSIVQTYGFLTYPIMFLIIFCETGLVVTPFLPGDSLLFAAGTISSAGNLNILALFFIILCAAIIGDFVNYSIGKYLGNKLVSKKYINVKYLEKTHAFYNKYGNETIVIARFLPIIRTFAPFVAGAGKMRYPKFALYNFIGAFLWVSLFLFAGYYLGNIPFVKENFSLIILLIIIFSLIPMVIEYVKYKSKK